MQKNLLDEFDRLSNGYDQVLVQVAHLREIERGYAIGKGLEPKSYDNPFRFAYDKERVLIDEMNKDVIGAMRHSLAAVFPNVPTTEETFKECVVRSKTESNLLNFDKFATVILNIEKNARPLTIKYIEDGAERLLPYRGYDDRQKPFILADIQKNKTLVLHSGWSYDRPRTDHEEQFAVYCYYVMYNGNDLPMVTKKQAQDMTGVSFKYYKNGRCDAIFLREEDAANVGRALISLFNSRRVKA
jgi:hypothetical protein